MRGFCRPETCHHGALGEALPRECAERFSQVGAGAGTSALAEGRVRVRHGEQVAGIPQGHLSIFSDGLGEVGVVVDVGGVDRKGVVEPADRAHDSAA